MINVPYTKQQIDQFFLILGQLHLLNLKARLIIFSQMIVAAIAQLYSFIFPKVVAKDPLKDVILNFTNASSNGRPAYLVNGKKELWGMPIAP